MTVKSWGVEGGTVTTTVTVYHDKIIIYMHLSHLNVPHTLPMIALPDAELLVMINGDVVLIVAVQEVGVKVVLSKRADYDWNC